jgi:hypothetical protein
MDAGVTLRYISGNMDVYNSSSSDVADFSTWVPMLYGKVRLNLPTTDLSLQLEANAVSYWYITTYDYELSARYTLSM